MGNLVKKYRAGQITATVWSNEQEFKGEKKEVFSVQFSKSYTLDDGKTWKDTNSLNPQDVPKAISVLQKAFDYLTVKEE